MMNDWVKDYQQKYVSAHLHLSAHCTRNEEMFAFMAPNSTSTGGKQKRIIASFMAILSTPYGRVFHKVLI